MESLQQRDIYDLASSIELPDLGFSELAQRRLDTVSKTPGSLGKLEGLVRRLAGIQRTARPRVERRRIVVFAADHGITEEDVSPYGSDLTGRMVTNYLSGGAGINALAKAANAELAIVDVGVAHPIVERPGPGAPRFVRRPVRRGTRNFTMEPAMTREELEQAMSVGISEAKRAADDGIELVGLGEAGIGNTTAASAITAALTQRAVHEVTGLGTGLDETGVNRKAEVIVSALQKYRDKLSEPLAVLEHVGGYEIAALAGFCLEAAGHHIAILVDGFITTAAFAVAAQMNPNILSYAFFSHRSAEPGHTALLRQWKEAEPLLDLELRLGEGTGAALAMPIVAAAVRAYDEMTPLEPSRQVRDA